jgi:LmbE family N-acetylglucosaminyl deacetylase
MSRFSIFLWQKFINSFIPRGIMSKFNAANTLFVGAHPDDVAIGAGITISRHPSTSYVVTVTHGARSFPDAYPMERPNGVVNSSRHYAEIRIAEDRAAMDLVGLPTDHYVNLSLFDQVTHNHMGEIVAALQGLVEKYGISQVVTHDFPQSHPDHEVVSVATHIVAQRANLNVLEYPLYFIDDVGRRFNCAFSSSDTRPKRVIAFTDSEFLLKGQVLKTFASQPDPFGKYTTRQEIFANTSRNLDDLTVSTPYIPAVREVTPEVVRERIARFLSERG